MEHSYSIIHEKIQLKPMTVEDSEQYRQIRNLEQNRKWFKYKGVIEESAQKEWYEAYLKNEKEYMFSVYTEDDDFIGGVSVYNVDVVQKNAEYGRLLLDSEKIPQRGLGRMVTEAVSLLAKDKLGLTKLYLDVYTNNIAAYKVYLYAGFETVRVTYDDSGMEMYFMEKDL